MRTKRRNCGQAFTLIELLVVISVLVLLISLLLPVMSKAVDAAREKQCMSGLKEVGSAFAAYEGDNNGCIPKCSTAAYCGVNYGPFLTWGAHPDPGRIPSARSHLVSQ